MNRLSPSLEMYLKTIYLLGLDQKEVLARDIASRLTVARPSVTGALRQLAEKRLVKYSPYESVSLTKKGLDTALDVVKRYETLCDFLENVLCLERTEAEGIACEMEHIVSAKALERLHSFLEFMNSCPQGKASWVEAVQGFRCFDKENCICELKHGSKPKQ